MQATMKIDKTEARKMIEVQKKTGGVFGVEFVKKDGTLRKMACRFGVKKHRTYTNVPPTTAHIDKYITVFEMKRNTGKNYKNVNLDTLKYLTIDGIKFEVY